MRATTTGDALAKTLHNALLWAPKDGLWNTGYLSFGGEGVSILTTDSYATTLVSLPCEVSGLGPWEVWAKVDRKALALMHERAGKAAKGQVTIEIDPRVDVVYADQREGEDLIFPDLYQDSDDSDESWDDITCKVLGEVLEDRAEEARTHRFMVNPSYMRKIAQTKKENPNICADVWVNGDDPVLVRVGAFSKTVIQPVSRDRHAEMNGVEVLWK